MEPSFTLSLRSCLWSKCCKIWSISPWTQNLGVWEQLNWLVLTQGCSWGCGHEVREPFWTVREPKQPRRIPSTGITECNGLPHLHGQEQTFTLFQSQLGVSQSSFFCLFVSLFPPCWPGTHNPLPPPPQNLWDYRRVPSHKPWSRISDGGNSERVSSGDDLVYGKT